VIDLCNTVDQELQNYIGSDLIHIQTMGKKNI